MPRALRGRDKSHIMLLPQYGGLGTSTCTCVILHEQRSKRSLPLESDVKINAFDNRTVMGLVGLVVMGVSWSFWTTGTLFDNYGQQRCIVAYILLRCRCLNVQIFACGWSAEDIRLLCWLSQLRACSCREPWTPFNRTTGRKYRKYM